MIILVTGAAGFIGFHTTQALLEQGHTAIGFDNLNEYYDPKLKEGRLSILRERKGCTFIRGDICDWPAVKQLFASYGFDTVIHLAAQAGVRYSLTHPEVYYATNIVGTFHIFEEARLASEENHLRFIFICLWRQYEIAFF